MSEPIWTLHKAQPWDYAVLPVPDYQLTDIDPLITGLRGMGSEGWELVTTITHETRTGGPGVRIHYLLFKRPSQ